MAKLLPPMVDRNIKSSGEKMLFELFRNSPFTKDWIILHSLNLSKHTKRLYGEIDFLILIPACGIYVMEVKAGDVKVVDGVWHFTDRFNKTFTSNVGPFNQARDAMFSLLAAIENEFGKGHRLTKIVTGFLCCFPHVAFSKHSPEYETWQVLDKNVMGNCEGFFKNLVQKTVEKNKGQKWFSPHESLPTRENLDQLCDFLRGDFERIRTLRDRLQEFDRNVLTYTKEQFRNLDSIAMNKRSIIQGSAGTGKTMIAMESAIRTAAEGKTVFLTCFNRLIGEWMHTQVSQIDPTIVVSSLHSYLRKLSNGFDYDKSRSDADDFFTSYLPGLLREMFDKGIFKKFDKLIIDEGQDLIREEYLDLFDSMLEGGLANGTWEIYGDFERQAIYSQLPKQAMIDLIDQYSVHAKFLLTINCRNTKQIGEEISIVSGFSKQPFLLEHLEGVPVEYIFYKSDDDQREQIGDQMRKLSGGKMPPGELTLISSRKYLNSCVQSFHTFPVEELKVLSQISPKQKFYAFATVHAFKGMESNYIFLTDIEDLTSEMAKSLLYIGMSRARYGLVLFIAESQRNNFREILKRKLG